MSQNEKQDVPRCTHITLAPLCGPGVRNDKYVKTWEQWKPVALICNGEASSSELCCYPELRILYVHTVNLLKRIFLQRVLLVSLPPPPPPLSHTYFSFSHWEPITSFLVPLQGTHRRLDRDLMYSVKPIKAPFIPPAHSAQFISSQ